MVFESGSISVVQMVKEGCSYLHPLFILVDDIRQLLSIDDSLSVNHVLREADSVADDFAKFGLSLDFCSMLFLSIPAFAFPYVRADFSGVAHPRFQCCYFCWGLRPLACKKKKTRNF